MNITERNLLTKSLAKYRSGEYDEKAFHDNLETVIHLLTESHFRKLRDRLEIIEANLERIDFVSSDPRTEYLKELDLVDILIAEYSIETRTSRTASA